jgi:single stranded DNA-binding protein
MNQVTLIGNVGKDAEIRETPEGTLVCRFSVATTDRWTDKDGVKQERTEWHNCRAWRGMAKRCSLIRKGDRVVIIGELKTDRWDFKCPQCQNIVQKQITYVEIRQFSISVKIDHQPENGEQPIAEENLPY